MEQILPDQGIAVRDKFFNAGSLLRAIIGACALVLVLGTHAMAQNETEDDDDTFEQKIIKNLFSNNKPAIDYRERSPLVVPPSTATLPPPEPEKAVANPAWPKDADTQRIKKAKRIDPRDMDPRDRADPGRALNPDELAGKRGPRGSGGLGAPDSRQNTDNASGRPLAPNELGSKGNVFSTLFSSKESTESAVFAGEPERSSLTDPPKGYLTPSPNYPYGLSPTKEAPTPLRTIIENRAVGRE